MGGITVNVNVPVAINGQTDAGIPPTGYIQPGADQHLDGFHALWYARGRYGADDYQRMARQRCVINAIIDQANPANLLRRYQALASAGSGRLHRHPQGAAAGVRRARAEGEGPPAQVGAVPIREDFNPNDPDFDYVHEGRPGAAARRRITGTTSAGPRTTRTPAPITRARTTDPGPPSGRVR